MGSPPVQVKIGHEAAILAANAAHVQPEHPAAEHKRNSSIKLQGLPMS